MADTVYLNGRAFDSGLIAVRTASMNEPFYGFKSLSYSEEEEIEMNYGVGQRAVSFGRGNINPEASLSLSYDSYQTQLVDSSPGGRIQDRPLEDLIVTYNHPDTGKIKTDIIRNCIFNTPSVDTNQNDKEFVVEITIISPEIVFGASGA